MGKERFCKDWQDAFKGKYFFTFIFSPYFFWVNTIVKKQLFDKHHTEIKFWNLQNQENNVNKTLSFNYKSIIYWKYYIFRVKKFWYFC